uniref:Adenylate kinase 9 n=1 Tax=Schistocephalus solidus TaxID=70667 RepID=A0A0X3NG87_SCHSO
MMVEVENTPMLIRTETFERSEVGLPDEFFVDQDLARERFLLKKPTCFIVIGKTACGKTTLAKKIASEWKCKYINPLNLFQNYMDENAALGKFLQNQLISGKEVPGETALALLKGAIESPEAHHYGYVLDGLPTYEGLEEIMNMLKTTHLHPDYVINITIPDADLRPRLESHRFDPEEGLVYNKFYMEDPPVVPPDPVAKVPPKPLKRGPEDGEVEEAEEEGEPEDEEVGEGDENLPSHPDFPRLDKKTLERLLVRPEDAPEEIERQFTMYRTVVRQELKEYMRSFPPSNVISVDGNSSPSDMYLSVMTQLRALPVRPAVPPHQFFPPTDEEEVPEDVEYEELIQTLATKRMPTEHARWQISPWQSLCPVQLYNGILENGKAQFSVGFLGQIFLLSSYEAFEDFIRNPRPFLIAPQPVIPMRIALVGHVTAGASSVARLVSERYNASYIDLDDLLREELTAMRTAFLDKVREETETKTIQTISEQKKRELDEIKTNTYTDDATAALTNTVVNVLAENTLEQMLKATSPQDNPPEDDETEAPDSAEVPGLLEPVTKDHPEVKKAVSRALSYAEIQPLILDAELYANKITEELAKLEQANMNIPKSKRRPISWVIDGLPPNVVVWEKIVEKSAEVRQALTTKRTTLESSRKAEAEAKRRAEEAMEEDEEGQHEKEPDPILEAARAAAELEKNKPIPIDPLPTFVFQLKDGLPDYALLMHRLYLRGYGPLKDVPRLVKQDNLVPAMEPMTDSQAAPTADDTTEAPPDLPASNVTFDPMPAPGPEVDYVLNWIRQFEAEWRKTTEFLGKTTSAYGYPAMFSDLDIGGKSYDDLYKEISVAIQKPLQRPAKESSQDELDEKADTEAEAFAEGGLEDYKPPGEEEGAEEEAEEEEEEAKEEAEEGEEEEEEMQPEEDPSKGPTRQLGRTSYFCPVALKEFQIMKPGDPEVVAEYLGKAYYFGTEEDRAKFLLEPTKYVDAGIQRPIKLPPLRICLVGPTGSGRSLHGRQLATRLNLIHISFPQLLQDIMLAKLHRNVGAQYADDKPIPLRVMPDLEEAVAKALAARENPDGEEAEPEPAGNAEPEDLPEIPLNAHEQAIRSHLQDDEELPRESLDLILKKFWTTEPYMSSGIILEGFPRNGEDVTYMQESNLFPDLCIAFMAEAEDIMPRLLPPRLVKWKIKQARIEANKKIEIEWKKAKRMKLYEARKKTNPY